MQTLLLSTDAWDLTLDVNGNIAVASNPYSLAQDAASQIQTYRGESYWDTEIGVPYLSEVLGKNPPAGVLKSLFVIAAMEVPEVASAKCFLTAIGDRRLSGQVQVVEEDTLSVAAANFAVVDPQGP